MHVFVTALDFISHSKKRSVASLESKCIERKFTLPAKNVAAAGRCDDSDLLHMQYAVVDFAIMTFRRDPSSCHILPSSICVCHVW